jgi:dTDP-4-dehydrorhamnose 3,5-epimerase
VAVDIRPESPTFKNWFGLNLSADNQQMLMIPVGFAHGFCVLSETAEVIYKCSSVYNGETEAGFAWDDSDIAVEWPIKEPLLSQRDINAKSFTEVI